MKNDSRRTNGRLKPCGRYLESFDSVQERKECVRYEDRCGVVAGNIRVALATTREKLQKRKWQEENRASKTTCDETGPHA